MQMVEVGDRMIKLTVLEINNYIYTLSSDNAQFTLNIEFVDIEQKVSANDIIYMDEEMIDENIVYTFGPLNSIYAATTNLETVKDIIILEANNERLYLQRYYG